MYVTGAWREHRRVLEQSEIVYKKESVHIRWFQKYRSDSSARSSLSVEMVRVLRKFKFLASRSHVLQIDFFRSPIDCGAINFLEIANNANDGYP